MLENFLNILSKGITLKQRDYLKSFVVIFPLVYVLLDMYYPQFAEKSLYAQLLYSACGDIVQIFISAIGTSFYLHYAGSTTNSNLDLVVIPTIVSFVFVVKNPTFLDNLIDSFGTISSFFIFNITIYLILFFEPIFKGLKNKYGFHEPISDGNGNKESSEDNTKEPSSD